MVHQGSLHKAQDQAREMNKGVGAQICQSRSSQVDLIAYMSNTCHCNMC
jgi:protein-tyrosine-phosphatase